MESKRALIIDDHRDSAIMLAAVLSGSVEGVAHHRKTTGLFDHAPTKPVNLDRSIGILLQQP